MLRRRATGRTAARSLSSVYFDTVGRDLKTQEIALRVWRVGRRLVQNLKVPAEIVGGARSRHEFETPVPMERPLLSNIEHRGLRQRLADIGVDNLEPIFRVDVKRTKWPILRGDGVRVDVDINEGGVSAGERTAAIAVVELQSAEADPRLLYELALEIHREVPLRPSLETKWISDTGSSTRCSRSRRRCRSPGSTAPSRRKRPWFTASIAASSIFKSLERPLLENDDPEGVHQMRVTLRQLRSIFRLYWLLLPGEQYDALVGNLKWLAGAIGPSREWDVFVDLIVAPVAEYLGERAGFGDFVAMIGERRDRHHDEAQAAVMSPDFGEHLIWLGYWMAKRSWREQHLTPEASRMFQPVTPFAATVLDQRFMEVRKLGKRITRLSEKKRHQLWIEVKRLRYALHFFEGLFPRKRVAAFTDRLVCLQDDLGYLNDVANARALVAKLVADGGERDAKMIGLRGGTIVGWHEHARFLAEKKLARDVGALLNQKRFWEGSKEDVAPC